MPRREVAEIKMRKARCVIVTSLETYEVLLGFCHKICKACKAFKHDPSRYPQLIFVPIRIINRKLCILVVASARWPPIPRSRHDFDIDSIGEHLQKRVIPPAQQSSRRRRLRGLVGDTLPLNRLHAFRGCTTLPLHQIPDFGH